MNSGIQGLITNRLGYRINKRINKHKISRPYHSILLIPSLYFRNCHAFGENNRIYNTIQWHWIWHWLECQFRCIYGLWVLVEGNLHLNDRHPNVLNVPTVWIIPRTVHIREGRKRNTEKSLKLDHIINRMQLRLCNEIYVLFILRFSDNFLLILSKCQNLDMPMSDSWQS